MASRSEENLHCPVCHEIFQDPVILLCSHSCWQRWWKGNLTECPVCKRGSLLYDPPQNLALRNLCEDFLVERTERPSKGSAALCSLHSEELKLFCLDHQQPVCVVCLHAETHKHHSFRPTDEAARDYKETLQELLKPLQEKLELFNDIKGNFDQTAKDIDVQAQDTEKQIKDVFLMLRKLLKKEERTRIAALREEKQQKTQMMKNKSEALNREIQTLSDTVRATEKVLRTENLSFLQRYKTAAETVQYFPLNDPQPIPGALIDMDKHLNNLHFNMLDRIRMKVTNTLDPQIAAPKLTGMSLEDSRPSTIQPNRKRVQGCGTFSSEDRLSRLRVGERKSCGDIRFCDSSQMREALGTHGRIGHTQTAALELTALSLEASLPGTIQQDVRGDWGCDDILSRLRPGERWRHCNTESNKTSLTVATNKERLKSKEKKRVTSETSNSFAFNDEQNNPQFVAPSIRGRLPPRPPPPRGPIPNPQNLL